MDYQYCLDLIFSYLELFFLTAAFEPQSKRFLNSKTQIDEHRVAAHRI